jgi:hypothetical protein
MINACADRRKMWQMRVKWQDVLAVKNNRRTFDEKILHRGEHGIACDFGQIAFVRLSLTSGWTQSRRLVLSNGHCIFHVFSF